MTDIWRVSFNTGFMLVLTQAIFPPFVIKPVGSGLILIITPGWRIWGGVAQHWLPSMILISSKRKVPEKS